MWVKNLLDILEYEMETPKPYGLFHLSWCIAALLIICVLYFTKKDHNERNLKLVLGIYGIPAFILEALKQIIWSVEYNEVTNTFVWDFQWYATPFQLCTMPIYISLICLFLRKGTLRDSLLSFMGYTTILGSIATVTIPHNVLVSDVLVDIHTMWLHVGSLVVSVYLLMSKEVDISFKGYMKGIMTFVCFIIIANTMNIAVYNSGILNGETFNMFYISPYFVPELPVFDAIYNSVSYPMFLATYVVALSLGSFVIFLISYMIYISKVKRNLRRK